jgi:hypothetical protein
VRSALRDAGHQAALLGAAVSTWPLPTGLPGTGAVTSGAVTASSAVQGTRPADAAVRFGESGLGDGKVEGKRDNAVSPCAPDQEIPQDRVRGGGGGSGAWTHRPHGKSSEVAAATSGLGHPLVRSPLPERSPMQSAILPRSMAWHKQ